MSEDKKTHWLSEPGQKGFRISEPERLKLIEAFEKIGHPQPDSTKIGVFALVNALENEKPRENTASTALDFEENEEETENKEEIKPENTVFDFEAALTEKEQQLAEVNSLLFAERTKIAELENKINGLGIDNYKLTVKLEEQKQAAAAPAPLVLKPNQAIIEFTPEQKQAAAKSAFMLKALGYFEDDLRHTNPATILHTSVEALNTFLDGMKTNLVQFKALLDE
jgi:hypothetical protein